MTTAAVKKATKTAAKAERIVDDAPVEFANAAALARWYKRHHGTHAGVWLRIAKKDSGLASIDHPTALGAALYWATPFNPWQAALMAFMICFMGFFGGLVMSAIKRDRGVKDWGSMIEGHGGMLDRLDSVIFAAPIYFHALRYWWVP